MNDYYDNGDENRAETEYQIRKSHEKRVSTKLLTIIQITVCSIIMITVIFLRFSGGNAYAVIRGWYASNISQTIVPDEKIENIKNRVVELFPASSTLQTASSQPSASSQPNTSSQKAAGSQQSTNSMQAADSQKLIG